MLKSLYLSDSIVIAYLKAYLSRQFHTKDLDSFDIFLESRLLELRGMSLSQHMFWTCFQRQECWILGQLILL